MEPNPKSFPILSYVMSRLNYLSVQSPPSNPPLDLENPPEPTHPPITDVELTDRINRINKNPALLASMSRAISDVEQSRSVLSLLGDRPDHEAVDVAKSQISIIDSNLSIQLDELINTPPPMGVGDADAWRTEKEAELIRNAEKVKKPYNAMIELDLMHEEYEKLLHDAEARLEKMYDEDGKGGSDDDGRKDWTEEIQMSEEVVGILQRGKAVDGVDLRGRKLRVLPEAFGKMKGLVTIDLSNNQLETIPDAIGDLEILEELCLSSNLLVALPDTIGLLVNLKILHVSGNKLKSLPDSICNCRSLVELDASYNALTYLPTKIGLLINLEKLWVHLNKLRSLPSSICRVKSLHLLDAHFNELRGLPDAIGEFTNLEYLNLSSNFSDLTELPSSFGYLSSLRELDLSNNQIHALPDTFGCLDKLVTLNLDGNPLEMPPSEIVKEGVEAVKEYMAKRWADLVLEKEHQSILEESPKGQTGWLTRSKSLLSSWVTDVSGSFAGYLGTGSKSFKDPFLDQQL